MTSLLAKTSGLVWLAVVSFAHGAAIVNGGFEAGIGPNANNWTNIIANPGAGLGTNVFRDNLAPHSGAFHMTLQVDSDLAPGEVFVVSDLFPIVPGEVFDLTFWSRLEATNGSGLVALYTVQFLDSDGSHGGGVKGQVGPTQFYGSLTVAYGQISGQMITAPNASTGADAAFVRFQFAGGAFAASDGRIFIDDVALVVPEPSSAGLVAVGLGLCVRRRRR